MAKAAKAAEQAAEVVTEAATEVVETVGEAAAKAATAVGKTVARAVSVEPPADNRAFWIGVGVLGGLGAYVLLRVRSDAAPAIPARPTRAVDTEPARGADIPSLPMGPVT